MIKPRERKHIDEWFGETIPAGESRDVHLVVSESYSSMTVQIPIHISRAKEDGPVVFVTAAMHGDEINGTGAIHQIVQEKNFQLLRGAVILVPVLNLLAFDRHSRCLPDRRDLNRSFPGSSDGSLASRMANTIFQEIVPRCDFGIDLHTAAIRRTNYPNIRGDLSNPLVRQLAESFGTEIIINNKGPKGSFRREASLAGCPTIIMEGGEVWKVEPGIVEVTVRGIKNVFSQLGMLDFQKESPQYQIVIEKSKWIRSDHGGFLNFHVAPGDIIEQGQPLATGATLLGREQNTLYAPFNAVVMGMTSLPAISPGEPICHLGKLSKKYKPSDLRRIRTTENGLEQKVSEELSSNVMVVDPS